MTKRCGRDHRAAATLANADDFVGAHRVPPDQTGCGAPCVASDVGRSGMETGLVIWVGLRIRRPDYFPTIIAHLWKECLAYRVYHLFWNLRFQVTIGKYYQRSVIHTGDRAARVAFGLSIVSGGILAGQGFLSRQSGLLEENS